MGELAVEMERLRQSLERQAGSIAMVVGMIRFAEERGVRLREVGRAEAVVCVRQWREAADALERLVDD